jgi:GNAT superfamily N-acetyltransferase
MQTTSRVRYSEIDTKRFGRRIFRAALDCPEDVALVWQECAAAGAEMLIVRCSSTRTDVAQQVETRGARLMDTIVCFERDLAREPQAVTTSSVVVRAGAGGDLPVLETTAREAFTGYLGHYHADPRLDGRLATEGYVDWFRHTTAAPDHLVLVALLSDVPVGFLSLRFGANEEAADIALNAVAPSAQRKGVYDALVKGALRECERRAVGQVRAATQLQNIAPQKVWIRNGFEPLKSEYTFHQWFC